jgi:hypothetical protein
MVHEPGKESLKTEGWVAGLAGEQKETRQSPGGQKIFENFWQIP